MKGQVYIPKIIMQTWKTHDLPNCWKSSQLSIGKYMPDWKYVLMSDDDNREFVKTHFPDFLPYYDAFPYNIQRADAVRYCWLYVNGGLYLDCDNELLDSLDCLFEEKHDIYLLASSNTPSVLTNGFMASLPGHKVWLDMIEEMKKPAGIYSIEKHLHVMYTTGPVAFDRVVKAGNYKYHQLPSDKINPYTLCETVYNKPEALIKPLPGSSWVGGAASVYQWCYCHSDKSSLAIILVILVVCLLIYIFLIKTN